MGNESGGHAKTVQQVGDTAVTPRCLFLGQVEGVPGVLKISFVDDFGERY